MIQKKLSLLSFFLAFAVMVAAQADTIAVKKAPASRQNDTLTVELVNVQPDKMLDQSERVANYKISARLLPKEQVVKGNMELTWKNYSQDTIRELQFHMYLNAFQNSKSTFFKEKRGRMHRKNASYPKKWGFVEIISAKVKGGAVLTDGLKFIQPDDNNKDDQTVAVLPLKKPLAPGEMLELKINFESKLPKAVARTGFYDDFFMVAQWFPKLGVYEPAGWRYSVKGHWNCHQFHANSEFYANFGNYDVDITLPKEYVIGATGKQVGTPAESRGMKTYVFHAHDVVDFAWTASKKYQVMEEQWKDVKLTLLLQPEHKSLAKRYFHSAKATLDYFDKHLGEYPYETLTLVDPPYEARATGGMEYPTLVTLGAFSLPEPIQFLESKAKMLEMVTVHEIGHQYFMGILASNEFEEPWLDEGFNTYWENRIMDTVYGAKTSLLDGRVIKMGDEEFSRGMYTGMRNPSIAENFRNSWEFTEGGYSTLSYQKTATWLQTLHNMVGDSAMSEIWKTYYKKWRFRHPNANSFIRIVNQVVPKYHKEKFGKDMNWFFEQFLYGSEVCDYSIERVMNGDPIPAVGSFNRKGPREEIAYAANQQQTETFVSKVVVHRLGGIKLPVEVLVHFEDGTEETLTWDGQARAKTFWIEGRKSKVLWAKLDPNTKITMDKNLINNSYTLKPSKTVFRKYLLKWTFWLQNIFEMLAMFV